MYTDSAQQLTQVTQFGTIQSQCYDSRSARCRKAYNNHKIFTPGKMPRPLLTAWVKERHRTPCLGIAGMSSVPFVAITTAGQGKILSYGSAVLAAWDDMIDFKGLCGERCRAPTVFTPPLRPISHSTA
jgi:hypothetical protein